MTLIVLCTGASGILANKALFALGLEPLWTRYPFAVLIAYGVFLGMVRIWLWAMTDEVKAVVRRRTESALDVAGEGADLLPLGTGRSANYAASEYGGSGKGEGGSGGSSSSWAPGVDDEGAFVLIVFGVLLTGVVVAGGYLVYEAPVILAETLFEFCLATALVKELKQARRGDWLGHLFSLTWKPTAAILGLAIVFSGVAYKYKPEARRVADLFVSERSGAK